MADIQTECPKCGKEMERGHVPDAAHGSICNPGGRAAIQNIDGSLAVSSGNLGNKFRSPPTDVPCAGLWSSMRGLSERP